MRVSPLLVCLVLSAVRLAPAQVAAALSGRVEDASGAPVHGAKVTVKSAETGAIRAALTDEQGNYRVLALAVGPHEVKAEKAGFRAAVRMGVNLAVGQEAVVNLRLEVGEITQEVTVSGAERTTFYPAISGVPPEWAWETIHYGSPDGLPVIGPHRNFPRHLFALGHGRHGAGVAWLAARVLLRAYLGEHAKGDELFGFARVL